MRPSVSVALATFNGERFVREQLDSIARQTVLPHELVVCDDGSTDRTVEIVRAFARESPFPVRLHENERRLGFAENFLRAARLCTGELIGFCDQDDVWLERKLERCVGEFEDPSVSLVSHSATVVDAELGSPRWWPVIRSRRTITAGGDPWVHIPGFAEVFSAGLLAVIDSSRRPRSRHTVHAMAHDEWIYFLGQVFGTVVVLPDRLVLHREHQGSIAGVPAKGFELARMSMQAGAETYETLAERAGEYARFLAESAGSIGDPQLAVQAQRGAASYRRVQSLWAARARLHEPAKPRRERFMELRSIIRQRGYRPRGAGGLGPQALLKDLAVLGLGR